MLPVKRVALLLILLSIISLNIAHAQATVDVVIFRSPDSLTIYLPGSTFVNISGLRIDATTATGQNLSQTIETLPTLRGLPFSSLPTPLCFHLTRATNAPLPLSCQTITTITQAMVDADVFWYDLVARGDRTLIITLGSSVQLCAAGSARCDLRLAVPPTPTANPTAQASATPTVTHTPEPTPTPDIPPGLPGNPLTSNDQLQEIGQAGVEHDGIAMLFIPAGCFMMGTDEEQAAYIEEIATQPDSVVDEQPAHEQCVDPFWMDRTEVTQADFARLGGIKTYASRFDGDNLPVENINWFEAREFCELRGMRLPTEREWEYAARGPDGLYFPWGNLWVEGNAVGRDNSNGQTANVGSLPEGNSWAGIADMSGNVWEWTSTRYGVDNGDLDFSDPAEIRYSYPYQVDSREEFSENPLVIRVARGGAWNTFSPSSLRASERNRFDPLYYSQNIGFRCVMDYTPSG